MTVDIQELDSLLDHVVERAQINYPRMRSLPWSQKEDDFLRRYLGWLSEEEIAAELGRSVVAVHLRWKRDLYLIAPSKRLNVITAHKAAHALGVEDHKVAGWVDQGLINGRIMPCKRRIRLINRISFFVWVISPKNWVYFNPRRVVDPYLKRLISLRMKRWGDEWWTTRQIADYHGVDVGDVKRYIQLGRLKSFRLPYSLGGRDFNRKWSNHFVLKSEATRTGFKFFRRGDDRCSLTKGGRRWIKRALAKGMNAVEIGRTMKKNHGTVDSWIRRYFPDATRLHGGAAHSRRKEKEK